MSMKNESRLLDQRAFYIFTWFDVFLFNSNEFRWINYRRDSFI